MKYFLVLLLFVVMAAGGRTMFEIAYHGMAFEHDGGPNADTYPLIFLALWYVLMMVGDIILLRNRNLPRHSILVGLLTVGILVPTIYKFINH